MSTEYNFGSQLTQQFRRAYSQLLQGVRHLWQQSRLCIMQQFMKITMQTELDFREITGHDGLVHCKYSRPADNLYWLIFAPCYPSTSFGRLRQAPLPRLGC